MKIFTVTTTRKFANDKDWEDYKVWFKSLTPHPVIDLDKLEKDGEVSLTTHRPGEDVISVYKLV